MSYKRLRVTSKMVRHVTLWRTICEFSFRQRRTPSTEILVSKEIHIWWLDYRRVQEFIKDLEYKRLEWAIRLWQVKTILPLRTGHRDDTRNRSDMSRFLSKFIWRLTRFQGLYFELTSFTNQLFILKLTFDHTKFIELSFLVLINLHSSFELSCSQKFYKLV